MQIWHKTWPLNIYYLGIYKLSWCCDDVLFLALTSFATHCCVWGQTFPSKTLSGLQSSLDDNVFWVCERIQSSSFCLSSVWHLLFGRWQVVDLELYCGKKSRSPRPKTALMWAVKPGRRAEELQSATKSFFLLLLLMEILVWGQNHLYLKQRFFSTVCVSLCVCACMWVCFSFCNGLSRLRMLWRYCVSSVDIRQEVVLQCEQLGVKKGC